MEIQLQELIAQIKKDGVETAEAEATAKLNEAAEKAKKIIADAKAEAEKILKQAKEENERMVTASEDAIRQAGRNLLISFRESVNKELNAVLGDNVKTVYSSDNFKKLIISVVETWAKEKDAEDITVLLNSNDIKSLEEDLLSALKEKSLSGVTLKPSDSFDGGFRIAVDNGKIYYDYSAPAVVEMLSSYLNPKVTALMKEAE